MKNVIENLERYYKSLLSQEQDLDFFLCLADYINFINQTPKTKEITDYLYRIAEKRTENLENQTKEIIKELNDTRKKLTNKIEKQGVKYEELRKIHKYFLRLFEKQSDLDGDSLISLFSGYIQCLLKSLYKNGYKEIVKEFATEKGNALKFNFLDKINHYSKEKNTYENDQITELWGAWQKLKVIQLEEIKEDRYSGFKKENYIGYATRIHNHLIEKLSKLTNQKKEKGELSTENLERIQKVLKIILDALEIQGINRLVDNKILIKKFEREGVFYEEVISILNKVNNEREKPILEVLNESIDYQELRSGKFSELERLENENVGIEFLDISREDLEKNIILRIENLNGLKEIKEEIDGKLKEVAINRVEEIKKQLEELREKQEERKELKQEILEEIKEKGEKKTIVIPKTFEIQVKDRYIWVNEYLLSKPHAVGSNFEFFEYVRSQPSNTKIERKNLLSQFGGLSIKEQVKNKGFIKILNELGFKGEILKAFFPKRGKNIVVYKGDKITKKDLEKAGIKIPLFLKELELTHLKNNPE